MFVFFKTPGVILMCSQNREPLSYRVPFTLIKLKVTLSFSCTLLYPTCASTVKILTKILNCLSLIHLPNIY